MSNINIGIWIREIVLPLFTCFCIIASSVISPLVMQAVEIETSRLLGQLPAAGGIAVVKEIHDIFFDTDSARIRVDAEPVLLDNAEILRQNPDVYVVIEGYCSKAESGSRGLAQIRAEHVKEYMVSEGVDPNRIVTVGMCPLYQVSQSEEDTESYPELDQRVHFTSLDKYSDNDFFFG